VIRPKAGAMSFLPLKIGCKRSPSIVLSSLPSAMDRSATIIAAVVAGSVFIWFAGHKISKRKRLPPGPRSLPLIGNTHQTPRQSPWLTYSTWAKQYGTPLVIPVHYARRS